MTNVQEMPILRLNQVCFAYELFSYGLELNKEHAQSMGQLYMFHEKLDLKGRVWLDILIVFGSVLVCLIFICISRKKACAQIEDSSYKYE